MNKTYKLGELIELCDERNTEGKYTVDDVKGIFKGEKKSQQMLEEAFRRIGHGID
ncbi:MAG: hypothetical protein HDR34_08405 [Treponema sp.]|nr:hypothetical protein [Treponema sp.]MBD5443401.1 hypothetical protein [Treponema sp.]